MKSDVLALWPAAPVVEAAASGRWLRFAHGEDAVYLQRYAWDEQSHAHYLVAGPTVEGRFLSLLEAVEAIRSSLAA